MYDANRILGIPIKSRHASELLKAYEQVYKWCKSRGFTPTLHRMDNETSKEVEEFIASQQVGLQYSAPGRHCAPAEKSSSDIQVLLQICNGIITARVPYLLLVQADTTGRSQRKHSAAVPPEPKTISVGSNRRRVSF